MPVPKEKVEHIHNWYTVDGVESRCRMNYKGHPCVKIKVGKAELERREAEYTNYYELCRSTVSKKDYDEMTVILKAFKSKRITIEEFREKTKLITDRLNKRMTFKTDDLGNPEYTEIGDYFTPPSSPNPFDPKQFYVLE